MSESFTLVTVVLGFGLVTVAGAWLGAGPHTLGAIFPIQPRDEWPHGVQESDVPHFAVEHGDALRPGSRSSAEGDEPGAPEEPARSLTTDDDLADQGPEIVELYSRRLATPH